MTTTVNMETPQFKFGSFSPKAKDFIKHSDAFINIEYGAVRSSKTISMSIRWIEYISHSPHREFLMTARTRDTLERNVITDLIKMLGNSIPIKFDKFNGKLTIGSNLIWCIGLNDEGSVDKVAGMTVGGWYADEVTRCPKSAIEMAISRCSLPDAKIFWNCNPDSPYHYIYTDYVDNTELLESGDVKVWHFLLDDNPNLTKEYKEHLKRVNSKSEVFYKRNILGEWVIAEGAIYDHFVESENTFTEYNLKDYDELILGCDYGVSTVCVFGVMGVWKNQNGNYYDLLDEWYYDAQSKGISKSDNEYLQEMKRLQDKYNIRTCYLPHDAKSLKTAAEKNHSIKMKLNTYKPDTYGDIETIQNLIATNHFRIHTSCKNSITQAQTYSWDTKAQSRGEDKPLKINDHCPDMWRGPIIGPMREGNKTAGVGVIRI